MQKNRPLSPHITMYAPQGNSMMSIFHRVAGVVLALSLIAGVVGAYACTLGVTHYPVYAGVQALGGLPVWVWYVYTLALCVAISYHMWNGIRHMVWDTGSMLELSQLQTSAFWVGPLACTTLCLYVARLFA